MSPFVAFGAPTNVTVFLRVMEYYPGLLFITTNQVGAIDDAFRSRIHLMLYYPPLSERQSRKIWSMNLRRLQAQSEARIENGMPGITIQKKGILAYGTENFETLHWNGRQIRNAFQTALALALFNANRTKSPKPVISKAEFHAVGKLVEQFDSYLEITHHGQGEAGIALDDGVRADRVGELKSSLKISDSEYSDSESEDEAPTQSSIRKGNGESGYEGSGDDGDGSDSISSNEPSDDDTKKKGKWRQLIGRSNEPKSDKGKDEKKEKEKKEKREKGQKGK